MCTPVAKYEKLINSVQTPTFLVLDIFEKDLKGEEVYEKLLSLSDQNTDWIVHTHIYISGFVRSSTIKLAQKPFLSITDIITTLLWSAQSKTLLHFPPTAIPSNTHTFTSINSTIATTDTVPCTPTFTNTPSDTSTTIYILLQSLINQQSSNMIIDPIPYLWAATPENFPSPSPPLYHILPHLQESNIPSYTSTTIDTLLQRLINQHSSRMTIEPTLYTWEKKLNMGTSEITKSLILCGLDPVIPF